MPPEAEEPSGRPSAENLAEARAIIERVARNQAVGISDAKTAGDGSTDKVIDGIGAGSTAAGLVWAAVALDPTGLAISAAGIGALLASWSRKRRRRRRSEEALTQAGKDAADLRRALELLGKPPEGSEHGSAPSDSPYKPGS